MRPLSLSLFIFVSIACFAQANTTMLWSSQAGPGFNWSFLSGNTLLVARNDTTQTTISGIDITTGTAKWTFKTLPGTFTSGVDPVGNYLQFRDIPLTIIDPTDGRMVIDGGAEHINIVYGYGFLRESEHIWLDAEIDQGRSLSLFDLSNGKKLWTRYDYFGLPEKTDITYARGLVKLGSKGGERQTLLCPPIN